MQALKSVSLCTGLILISSQEHKTVDGLALPLYIDFMGKLLPACISQANSPD